MRHSWILTAALLATLATPSWARDWRQSFPVTEPASVRVRTDDARVQVLTRESGPVEVVVHHDAKTWGWTRGVREPRVSMRREGEVIVVEADLPGDVIVFGGYTLDFSITITMPRRGTLSVHTGDGRIECQPLTGDIRLETGDGRIEVTGLSGTIEMHTGDGRIEAAGLDGVVSARTGDGRLKIEGRFDRLVAQSGDGSIEVSARAGSKLAEPWSIETQDGGVNLRIPRDLSALLDADTGDGRIVVDLPIEVPSRMKNHLTGQLNGGSVPLRVRTNDGRITLALSSP